MGRVKEFDKKDGSAIEIFNKMKFLGYSGLIIVEEYGAAGRDIFTGITVVEELSKCPPALDGYT